MESGGRGRDFSYNLAYFGVFFLAVLYAGGGVLPMKVEDVGRISRIISRNLKVIGSSRNSGNPSKYM